MSESITGTVESVVFHNAENGFAVLRVSIVGRSGLFALVGQTPAVVAGESFIAAGVWRLDPEHGEQFQATSLTTSPPTTRAGVEKYLGSGFVRGIGPTYAKKIVDVFGDRTLAVIDESPAFLREIRGIGPKRIQEIRESWRRQKAVREIVMFLHANGVGPARASRIHKLYGDAAVAKVKENPYRLADDVWGFGFASADALAQRLGIDAQSPVRARAAVRHALAESEHQGHCGVPEDELVARTAALAGLDETPVREAVAALTASGDAVRDTALSPEPRVGLARLVAAERDAAETLARLLQGPGPLAGVDANAAVAWVENRMGLALARQQREAIRLVLREKVVIVTGGPGVGKTTLVRGILETFRQRNLRCSLAAPTGRAARRLSESAGHPAVTLHRLLEFGSRGAQRNERRPLEHDLLVVDEMSMVDLPLFASLVKALPAQASLVLVGDPDQLPSVGPGAVLADLLASRVVPSVRLTEIFRQAQESGIVRAAYAIHDGEMPEPTPAGKLGDFYFVEADSPARIRDLVVSLVVERIPKRFGLDPVRDVQVLAPMHRADLGVQSLNQHLQQVLNPAQGEPEATRFGLTLRPGDKVLQTANDYEKEVFNGDVGRVRQVDVEDQSLVVDFDGREIPYTFDELDELSLAYALTIHKSQGSEYPAVVVPLHTQHFLLLQRNLLYTAVTRGKQLVTLVGSRKALETAVSRADASRRYTALAERLRAQT